ncbi:PIN domain-containing protein [Cypionkella sinensis]|uniref:PIN domain-containing protein n=1 Tax=Cypionkella sinensis TaxID=1756043 RepID=A0ABV7J5M4_9RHOB
MLICRGHSQLLHRIFVDTNCFLHLRDLKDLPWKEIFPNVTELDIFVAPIVIDELDRLKTEKNDRIRKRCRAALKMIEEASRNVGMRLELKVVPFRVNIVVAVAPPVSWSLYPKLDVNRPDDQLIASALTEPLEGPPTLLSFDTGPLIRARSVNLHAISSPENWGLPAQQDESEKKISRLEAELKEAKANWPLIDARLTGIFKEDMIYLPIPELAPLSNTQLDIITDSIRHQFPIKEVKKTATVFNGMTLGVGGITGEQVSSYRTEYELYIARWRQKIACLHSSIKEAFRFGEVSFSIINRSNVTAINLRVSMNCSGNFIMIAGARQMESFGGVLQAEKPPSPPTDIFSNSRFENLQMPMRDQRRDPTGFYWLEPPDTKKTEAALVCDEFRAKQSYSTSFYVFGDENTIGKIWLEVSAKNLDSPILIEANFKSGIETANWNDPFILDRLPDWLVAAIVSTH